MFERDGTFSLNYGRERFHVIVILIVGCEEEHWETA